MLPVMYGLIPQTDFGLPLMDHSRHIIKFNYVIQTFKNYCYQFRLHFYNTISFEM